MAPHKKTVSTRFLEITNALNVGLEKIILKTIGLGRGYGK
jgi:hypothetical protein